jgi:hypothetical protein
MEIDDFDELLIDPRDASMTEDEITYTMGGAAVATRASRASRDDGRVPPATGLEADQDLER